MSPVLRAQCPQGVRNTTKRMRARCLARHLAIFLRATQGATLEVRFKAFLDFVREIV